MRVISGKYGGQKIKYPKATTTRPMMDYVKESLFNSLNNFIDFQDNVVALDLFAGSGQLGIEVLSRGGKKVYFNDNNRKIYQTILKSNLKLLQSDEYEIYNLDYLICLQKIVKQNIKINLLILDPPFAQINFYYKIFDFICKYPTIFASDCNNLIITESQIPLALEKYNKTLLVLQEKYFKRKYIYILLFRFNVE